LRNHHNTKPKKVNYFGVPWRLWRLIKRELPKEKKHRGPGRPRVSNRAVINGLWYILWTGCQWKAVKRERFGVSSSVLHERFQTWQREGRWEGIMRRAARYDAREQWIAWKWQSIDSKSIPAPLGGAKTGRNPTDQVNRAVKFIFWSTNAGRHWRSL